MRVRRLGDHESLVDKTQVEYALLEGATNVFNGLGADGGYVDYTSNHRGSISWGFNVARARTATLSIR